MNFRIAVLQKRSGDSVKENVDMILHFIEQASAHRADILLMPECFVTGYKLPIGNDEAVSDNGEWIETICRAALEKGIGVVATALTKGRQKPQNSAFVIDKKGRVLMKYSKVHTCDFADERCLESGDEFKVCIFEGVKLGIMICYDREYPESARVLMMKGAELILVPNDCGAMKPRIQALSTRAYENMVGVVMANPCGANAGNSCAFSPICWDHEGNCVDNTILMTDAMSEGLFYADFDMDEIRRYREQEMMGNTFRKVKAYGELMNETIRYPFCRDGQERKVGFAIRKYQHSDCVEMAELFYQTVHAVNIRDYTDEQVDAWVTGNVNLKEWDRSFSEHVSVVAVKDGKIVGFGDMDASGYLDRLYVHKDFQNQGIAAAICDALEKKIGAVRFTTHASITARPFFEHRGYRMIKEQQVIRRGVSLTNYIMEKRNESETI